MSYFSAIDASVSYSQTPNEQGKERPDGSFIATSIPGLSIYNITAKTMRIVQDASSHPEASGPLHPELQFARCMSNRYKNEPFPRLRFLHASLGRRHLSLPGHPFFLERSQPKISLGSVLSRTRNPDAPAMTFPGCMEHPSRSCAYPSYRRYAVAKAVPLSKIEMWINLSGR